MLYSIFSGSTSDLQLPNLFFDDVAPNESPVNSVNGSVGIDDEHIGNKE